MVESQAARKDCLDDMKGRNTWREVAHDALYTAVRAVQVRARENLAIGKFLVAAAVEKTGSDPVSGGRAGDGSSSARPGPGRLGLVQKPSRETRSDPVSRGWAAAEAGVPADALSGLAYPHARGDVRSSRGRALICTHD